jgi:hypothetical protein
VFDALWELGKEPEGHTDRFQFCGDLTGVIDNIPTRMSRVDIGASSARRLQLGEDYGDEQVVVKVSGEKTVDGADDRDQIVGRAEQ